MTGKLYIYSSYGFERESLVYRASWFSLLLIPAYVAAIVFAKKRGLEPVWTAAISGGFVLIALGWLAAAVDDAT